MPSINVTSDSRESIATAALVRLSCFDRRPAGTVDMSDATPVLTCRLQSSLAGHITTNCSPSRVVVGYTTVAESHMILIRLQFGDVQVCWIAELAVPAIWGAVETWRQEGQVPMVFYPDDGECVSKSVCVGMPPSPVPMPSTWIEPDATEAAGQFFISEAMQLAS